MKAGKLRHRIKLQSRTQASDGGGGFTDTWADFATVWAAVEPLTGNERFEAQQLEGELSHRVTLRHRSDVTTEIRAVHQSRVLEIRAVIRPEERNAQLLLLCSEEPA